jgi:hypothetical protein
MNGLLYNHGIDGIYTLCSLREMVGTMLAMVHDENYHYGYDHIIYKLLDLAIHDKTYQVKQYIKHYPSCTVNINDYSILPGNYQSIRPNNALLIRVISLDLMIYG